jgi:hypothetical protein
MQAVAVGWHEEGAALAGVSQQCCIVGSQYSLGPPSTPLNGQ